MTRSNVAGVATFHTKAPVRAKTALALAAFTRVGNTYTANANGALGAIDGVALNVGDRLLYQVGTGADVSHGILAVSSLGGAGAPWVLVRASDANTTEELAGGEIIAVTEGTAAETWWSLSTDAPTLNTTALTFAQFAGAGVYVPVARTVTAGNGLVGGGDLSANRALAVQATNASVVVSAGGVAVGTITTQVLAALAVSAAAKDLGGGAITNVGPVDGRTLAADGAKLDGLPSTAVPTTRSVSAWSTPGSRLHRRRPSRPTGRSTSGRAARHPAPR